MGVKTPQALAAIYRHRFYTEFHVTNTTLAGPFKTIITIFDGTCGQAYTRANPKKPDKLSITIGGELIKVIASLPAKFSSKKQLKTFLRPICKAFYALNYHEMGHVVFTDMGCDLIHTYKEPKYIPFLANLANIIEDPVIEINIADLFDESYPGKTNPRVYFDFLIDQMFKPQLATYVDNGDADSFLNYLLLSLRCGLGSVKNPNAAFDKYKSGFMPLLKDALTEPDATERIKKCIVLGEWLINNIKEIDWTTPEEPAEPPISGRKPPVGPSGKPVRGKGKSPLREHEEPKGPKPEVPEEELEIEHFEKELFDDLIQDGYDHEWIIAKDEYELEDPAVLEKIENSINEYNEAISRLAKFFTLFHDRAQELELGGYLSGRLNIFDAMQKELQGGSDIRVFNRSEKFGEDVDLAVSLVCDNSGSMSGTKSHICAQAALVLAQACEWSNIPFECNAFTKTFDGADGISLTINIKSFEDSFESAKQFFAINDYNWVDALKSGRPIPTFCGNSEEVNLYHIWQKLKECPHQTKIMFVLCDGMTCGSVKKLEEVRAAIEADGIIVIGIGICCDAVKNSYPNHKLFKNTTELKEGLANYLVDTLSKFLD